MSKRCPREGVDQYAFGYHKNRDDAKERLRAAGWKYERREGNLYIVEGCITWHPKNGAWYAHDGSKSGTGVGAMMHYLRQHRKAVIHPHAAVVNTWTVKIFNDLRARYSDFDETAKTVERETGKAIGNYVEDLI